MHDPATGVTTLVSADAAGTESGNGATTFRSPLSVSADGRRIALLTSASDLGPNDTNGQPDVYVATLRAADLGVAIVAAPQPVATGATLGYHVTVTNAGPDPADEVAATLVAPEGIDLGGIVTTVGSCVPPPPENPRAVVCDIGDIDVGQPVLITVVAEVTAAAGASLEAIAAATSSTLDDNGRDNVAVVATTVV